MKFGNFRNHLVFIAAYSSLCLYSKGTAAVLFGVLSLPVTFISGWLAARLGVNHNALMVYMVPVFCAGAFIIAFALADENPKLSKLAGFAGLYLGVLGVTLFVMDSQSVAYRVMLR